MDGHTRIDLHTGHLDYITIVSCMSYHISYIFSNESVISLFLSEIFQSGPLFLLLFKEDNDSNVS